MWPDIYAGRDYYFSVHIFYRSILVSYEVSKAQVKIFCNPRRGDFGWDSLKRDKRVKIWYNRVMDFEKIKRRQTIRLVVTESLMVLSVVALVVVLVLVVSGYWINANFEVERSGLLQVSSAPTGAVVTVDDGVWFQRTNTSKMISSGKHTLTVSKDGYDTWTKDVEVPEGLLYRLHYPRLFLLERTVEEVLPMTELVKVTVSPKRDSLLVYQTSGWSRINLNSDTPVAKVVTSAEATGLLQDWEKITAEAENYDEDGNIILRFYEDQYVVKLEQDTINVVKKDSEEKVLSERLPFVPKAVKVGHRGEFIVMNDGVRMVTLDMETMSLVEWAVESENFGWMDNDLMYVVDAAGKLIVYDYDGLNRRKLASGVSSKWPIVITNDKWMYYFNDNGLVREWLIPHNS